MQDTAHYIDGKTESPEETLTDSKSPGLWFPCLGYFPLASYGLEGRREVDLQC